MDLRRGMRKSTRDAKRCHANSDHKAYDNDSDKGVHHHRSLVASHLMLEFLCAQHRFPHPNSVEVKSTARSLTDRLAGCNQTVYYLGKRGSGIMKRFLNRHRRSLALAGSLLLHGAVMAVLIMPASGALSTLDLRDLGDTDQKGIAIELIEPVSPRPKLAHPAQATENFVDMTEPPATDGWKADAAKPATSLSDIFGKDLFAQSPQAAQTTKPSPTDSHIKMNNRTSASMNDLWKAIEPCWRRLADKNTTGVTLSVSFSPLGNLSKPPVIVRDPAAHLTDRQLRSESLAINALAQCGPYLMAFGQNDVSVQFPAGG